jgi:hypothetical protein
VVNKFDRVIMLIKIEAELSQNKSIKFSNKKIVVISKMMISIKKMNTKNKVIRIVRLVKKYSKIKLIMMR